MTPRLRNYDVDNVANFPSVVASSFNQRSEIYDLSWPLTAQPERTKNTIWHQGERDKVPMYLRCKAAFWTSKCKKAIKGFERVLSLCPPWNLECHPSLPYFNKISFRPLLHCTIAKVLRQTFQCEMALKGFEWRVTDPTVTQKARSFWPPWNQVSPVISLS